MKILITGASGFIGSALTKFLNSQNFTVLPLLRKRSSQGLPFWDPGKGEIDLGGNSDIEVIINLAGENISQGRWTEEKKSRILNSRIKGTRLIAEWAAKQKIKPHLLISGSAIGYYGDRKEETVDETAKKGEGFLAEVCEQWEKATAKASEAGIRVVNMRTGVVLSPEGGALKKMLIPFRLGLGGKIGDGQQFVSWISLTDLTEIIGFIIATEKISGPVNFVSPNPVRNQELTQTLARVLRRPAILPLPAALARIIFGEMAQEMLLSGAKVIPRKLLDADYKFRHPHLAEALRELAI